MAHGLARPPGRGAAALRRLVACSALVMVGTGDAAAQTGSGTTGGAVLQLPGGGRAAAMAGAYVAGSDGDVIFYNPAGAAWLRSAFSAAYQRHVDEIGFGTAAAARAVGPVVAALSFAFLDYGSIAEVVPDPGFGGQRGQETGQTVGATEIAGKAAVAARLADGRLALGASFGVFWVSVAETARTAMVLDAGAQYRLRPELLLGAALRNAGPDLKGALLGAAPLPSEARLGAAWRPPHRPGGVQLAIHGDLVTPLNGGHAGPALGAEAAIDVAGGFSAALRAGFNGAHGPSGLGRAHLGAGLAHGTLAVDYAFQDMGVLGAVHRFGVRLSR
jgi:hypothetical protein